MHHNRHPKCFGSKVMVKDIFLQNGGQHNAFAYVSCTNCLRYFKNTETLANFYYLCKSPYPSYQVLKFGNLLQSTNRNMAKNVISQKVMTRRVNIKIIHVGQNKWHHLIKDAFLQNSNITRSCTSHIQTAHYYFFLLYQKALAQATL